MQHGFQLPSIRELPGAASSYASNTAPRSASRNGDSNDQTAQYQWEQYHGQRRFGQEQGYAMTSPQRQQSPEQVAAQYSQHQPSATSYESRNTHPQHDYSAHNRNNNTFYGPPPPPPSSRTPQPPSVPHSAQSGDPGNDNDQTQLELCLEFADKLANSLGLASGLRGDLRHIAEIVAPLPLADAYSRIFSQAMQLEILFLARTYAERMPILEAKLDNLLERIRATWELSNDQKTEARKVIRRLLCDTKRTSYSKLHSEVLEQLRTDQDKLGLKDAFETPTQEGILLRYIKESCGSIRGHLREHIVASLQSKNKKYAPLPKFAASIARGYLPGVPTTAFNKNNKLVIHLAILRHLAMENWEIATTAADDGGDSDDENIDPRDNTEPSDTPVNPGSRKRKRQLRKMHWWPFVQEWFSDKCAEHGTDRTSVWWSDFIQRIIRIDIEKHGGREALENIQRPGAPAQQGVASTPSIQTDNAGRGTFSQIFP